MGFKICCRGLEFEHCHLLPLNISEYFLIFMTEINYLCQRIIVRIKWNVSRENVLYRAICKCQLLKCHSDLGWHPSEKSITEPKCTPKAWSLTSRCLEFWWGQETMKSRGVGQIVPQRYKVVGNQRKASSLEVRVDEKASHSMPESNFRGSGQEQCLKWRGSVRHPYLLMKRKYKSFLYVAILLGSSSCLA